LIRIAAVGDLHVAADNSASWRERLRGVNADADLLLLAGDLTRAGTRDEAESLRRALGAVEIPMLAVLGNHDYHYDFEHAVIGAVERCGGRVLEGDSAVVEVGALRVGVAGTKGFGGGFVGACGSDFGEPQMKAFIRHTRALATALRDSLAALETDMRIALLHYSPVADTLAGERCEIYPFLGSYLLAEAIDTAGADLAIHGHAHAGTEKGLTAGGVHVRNVAEPVIRSAYRVYCFDHGVPGEHAEQTRCSDL
jgi:Icc-related predicted phosphoesterase